MRMPLGASSWSFTEEDHAALNQVLQRFLFDSNTRCALLVDRSGQLVTVAGDRPTFDVAAFASLTAADFSANAQLARLIGETDFNTLFHQGEKESMLLGDVARRVILVALFDNRTTLGLVRLKMRGIVDELGRLIERSLQRSQESNPQREPLLGDVDDEIDRLFQ
ncbi:MAG: roadblock/LC7 domain-containing protein [Gemmatimonadetes bacterium]|nr:roadblock/LC7 domain-containing protein [Gemmatimonadota bacterium]MCC6773744.1 roadblock/LC7 domain-containing protein [Gemmatimonadaceae bacterium]